MQSHRLRSAGLLTILALGALLRMLYAVSTPYWVHAYDWQGHHQYIRFIFENGHLPAATFGWETFQPPLFYVVCAAWLKYTAFLEFGYGSLQIISIAMSIMTLITGLWIGTMIFQKNDTGALLFGLLIAVFPGLIVLSSQITNDGLLTLLLFILIGLLLRWQESKRTIDILSASAVLGLALLTKSTALLILPVLVLSILTATNVPRKHKAALMAGAIMIVMIIAGWFFVLRFGIEKQTSIVGNETGTHELITVPLVLRDFVTFNPIMVMLFPLTDDLTTPRREILFEHLLKTAHFGHHYVVPKRLASVLLLTGCFMLVMMLIGVRSKHVLGRMMLLSMCAVLIIGIVLHRFHTPSVANEDFRFIVPVIIPIFAFAVHAATESRKKYGRIALVGTYASLCFAVVLTLVH